MQLVVKIKIICLYDFILYYQKNTKSKFNSCFQLEDIHAVNVTGISACTAKKKNSQEYIETIQQYVDFISHQIHESPSQMTSSPRGITGALVPRLPSTTCGPCLDDE